MANYNFTDRFRGAMGKARAEAIDLQHDYVGTEHLLLGAIADPRSTAVAVLRVLGAELEVIRHRVGESIRKGRGSIALGELPYTSRAKVVLEYSMSEARDLDHAYVGTEHLLLGLVREEKGVAAQVLASVGATLDATRAATLAVLELGPPPPAVKAKQLWMVVERFKNRDAAAVYARFREQGRMMPDGLEFVASWVETNTD